MSTDRPTRDTMSIEEATIANMWEITAIVEVLERKGPARMVCFEKNKSEPTTPK